MKQQHRIILFLFIVLLIFPARTLVYPDPLEPTPGPTGGITPAPTGSSTLGPIQEPTPTPTGQIPYQIYGDVNSDTRINIVDSLLIAQFYVGMNPDNFNTAVANVNNDDKIDIVDALLVAQYYVGILPGF